MAAVDGVVDVNIDENNDFSKLKVPELKKYLHKIEVSSLATTEKHKGRQSSLIYAAIARYEAT